jgi:tetratricopeptide (TPR) repeat protein
MWKLLTAREQEVFQGISVFRGGFTRQAVQQVTGASARELMSLVNSSLLRSTPGGRYEVHELLRQYAAEQLEQSPDVSTAIHDRHSAYYTAQLQQWERDLKGPRQRTAVAEIKTESENARAAWYWAVERGHIDIVRQAMDGLGHFYAWQRRSQEGMTMFRMAVEKLTAAVSGEDVRVVARLLTWQGEFHGELGHTDQAGQLLQHSLDILDSPQLAGQDTRSERALVLSRLGWMHWITTDSDYEEAQQCLEHSLRLYRSVDDHWATANVLHLLGRMVFHHSGNRNEAQTYFEESLRLRQSQEDHVGMAESLVDLSWVLARTGELEEAERLIREGIAIYQQIGDQTSIAKGLMSLANTHLYRGEFVKARPIFEESLAIFSELEMHSFVAVVNALLGWNKINLGLYEEAQLHIQTGLRRFQEVGNQLAIGLSYLGLGEVEIARQAYVEAQHYLENGLAITREIGQPEEESLLLLGLGHTAMELGQLSQARHYLWEALQKTTKIENFAPALFSIATAALFLAKQDEPERAVELHALASRFPYYGNSRFREETVGHHITAAAATLPPEVMAAAQERGRQSDLHATAKEVLAELQG